MKKRFKLRNIFTGIFALVLVVICILPFAYIFFRSFVVFEKVTFQSYYDVFLGSPKFLFRFWKSMGMSVAIAAGQLLVSVMAGYGFGRYKFRGRDTLFFLLMILMTLPVQVTLVPNFIMLNNLGLLDTYAALILPSIFVPLGTFILTQSFKSISDSVIDAAMIDGCGIPKLIALIAVPMNKSGLVCVLLLSFLDAWNMVEQPVAYLKEFTQYPISVALAYTPPADPSIQMVCCILVVVPALFLFTLFNKELVEGIVLAEIK